MRVQEYLLANNEFRTEMFRVQAVLLYVLGEMLLPLIVVCTLKRLINGDSKNLFLKEANRLVARWHSDT